MPRSNRAPNRSRVSKTNPSHTVAVGKSEESALAGSPTLAIGRVEQMFRGVLPPASGERVWFEGIGWLREVL